MECLNPLGIREGFEDKVDKRGRIYTRLNPLGIREGFEGLWITYLFKNQSLMLFKRINKSSLVSW